MADPVDAPPPPSFKNTDASPFIYFDFAPTFGVLGGAVQIELAARVLVPGRTEVGVEFVATAHLRCSPAAALDLRNALDQALDMLQGPPPEDEGTGSTKH
jgi:hypothetical protein